MSYYRAYEREHADQERYERLKQLYMGADTRRLLAAESEMVALRETIEAMHEGRIVYEGAVSGTQRLVLVACSDAELQTLRQLHRVTVYIGELTFDHADARVYARANHQNATQ